MEVRGVTGGEAAREPISVADAERVASALLRLAESRDASTLRSAALAAVREVFPGGAFLAVVEAQRLRIVGAHDIERDRIEAVARSDDFRALVSGWVERPVPDATVTTARSSDAELVCAPFFVAGTFAGVLTLLVTPGTAATWEGVLGTIAAHVAIHTERLASERTVDRLDHEADSLIGAAPVPMLVVGPDDTLVRANAPACEVFGISGSFDTGRSLKGRLGSAELEELVFSARRSGEIDVEIGRPPRRFRATVVQVYEGPECVGRILALADLTAEVELRRARDDFVAMVGHELRTPITVIRGFAETLVARGASATVEQQSGFLNRIAQQADHLNELIEDLLCLSTERDRVALSPTDVDVAEVAGAVVDTRAARHPDRTIEVLPLGGSVQAVADPVRLAQVIRHLVDNAVKYSDGPVRVEVRGGESVEVAVVDQGDGIFSGDLGRLFEPFEQRDRSATREHGGSGLGLHLCRRLVELMGGRLDVDTRLGQGSRFSFQLPAATRVPGRRPARESAPIGGPRDDSRS